METREVKRFKPFRETYTKVTFGLCAGMIYPNPRTEAWRLAAIPILLVSVSPLAVLIFIDMYSSWTERDTVNIIRHGTVIGPFLGGIFKMVLMFHKRVSAKHILDEIDRDHERFNHLSSDYKQVAAQGVHNSLVYEQLWVVSVTFCVVAFPTVATALNMYNILFVSEPTMYMVHDVNKPFDEKEAKFESPFFEFTFAYTVYYCIVFMITFIGYDGFFGLSISHACLKMDMYCKALELAMAGPRRLVRERVVAVIREQNRMFQFVNWIQETFNLWLGIIFFATMIQMCTCMYQLTEGANFDLRYVVFLIGSIIHIFIPCRYAAKLKDMASQTPTKFYCCGWENVPSQSIRKMIRFMIARGQDPVEITAFKILYFNMELFVSILQSSYSMLTLLRS